MKRRDFFTNTAAGLALGPMAIFGNEKANAAPLKSKYADKNIIFMVSDGMSTEVVSGLGENSEVIVGTADTRASTPSPAGGLPRMRLF